MANHMVELIKCHVLSSKYQLSRSRIICMSRGLGVFVTCPEVQVSLSRVQGFTSRCHVSRG